MPTHLRAVDERDLRRRMNSSRSEDAGAEPGGSFLLLPT